VEIGFRISYPKVLKNLNICNVRSFKNECFIEFSRNFNQMLK
jgi:hypothetical protein